MKTMVRFASFPLCLPSFPIVFCLLTNDFVFLLSFYTLVLFSGAADEDLLVVVSARDVSITRRVILWLVVTGAHTQCYQWIPMPPTHTSLPVLPRCHIIPLPVMLPRCDHVSLPKCHSVSFVDCSNSPSHHSLPSSPLYSGHQWPSCSTS